MARSRRAPAVGRGRRPAGGGPHGRRRGPRLAGLCGSRLCQGRPDAAGAARFRRGRARRPGSGRRALVHARTIPRNAPLATRRRDSWTRPGEQLANLQSGGKQTEIQQAEANLADARATLVRTAGGPGARRTLLRDGFATRQSVDQVRPTEPFRPSESRGRRGRARANARPARPRRRDRAQEAAVAAARAGLEMAEWRLASGASPHRSRRASPTCSRGRARRWRPARPSCRCCRRGNIFVRFFVPEPRLAARPSRRRGGARAATAAAPISPPPSRFISPQAEYTPPVIYSERAGPSSSIWSRRAAAGRTRGDALLHPGPAGPRCAVGPGRPP